MSLEAISRIWVAALFVSASHAASTSATTTPEYQVTHTVALGAPDRWDYVVFDPSSKRVFVAHGDEVTVVDGRKGDVGGHIKGFPRGTHG